jgi:leader peptidase (prepilin peptidase) / N-methyltransferase
MLIGGALAWMSALIAYDLRQRRLPNWLTIPGFVGIMLASAGFGHFRAALVGAVGLGAVYLAVHLVARAAMGAGDVKLALGLGALTGCFGGDVWLLAAIGAPSMTVVIGMVARVGWSMRTMPHGPSMCVASAAAVGLVLA